MALFNIDGYDLSLCPVHVAALYSNASEHGQRTTLASLNKQPIQAFLKTLSFKQNYAYYSWKTVNDFDTIHEQHRIYDDNVWDYFPMGFLMRLNSDFRHRVNIQRRRFYMKTHPHFAPSSDCIAIHIRRDDRIKQGILS